MVFIDLPFGIEPQRGVRAQRDEAESIRSFLDLMVCTPLGGCEADPEFGFIFKSFRFENFNEDKGTLYSSTNEDALLPFHDYKVHGSSKNFKTFAFSLKQKIEQYEPRLKQVQVAMDYRATERIVLLTVNGVLAQGNGERFEHIIRIHIW